MPSASSRRRREAAVARSSAWPCSRRSTSAWRSARTRRRSATPATRTSSSWRRRVSWARCSSSARQPSSASSRSGRDRASCACSAATSASTRCASVTAARASSSSPARRRCSSVARARSARPDSQAEACRSAARSAAARPSRARASTMRASVRWARASSAAAAASAGPAPGLLGRGCRHHAGGRAHPPARGGEAVALGGHHDEVVAGEGEVDRLLPAVDADRPADERVQHGLGSGPAAACPDVGAHRLGAAAGRERIEPRCAGGRRRPGAPAPRR